MRIALCQVNSRDDRAANLKTARELLERAAAGGADFAMLPEYVDFLGPTAGEPDRETVTGTFATFFSEIAQELGIWVHAGSFHEAGPDEERSYNTSLVFDRDGTLVGAYRKIHLFDVEIPGRVAMRESSRFAAGSDVVAFDLEGVRVGMSICYDLRFPELYRQLAIDGAQVLLAPAAFTTHTGRDHWEVLLRARAIENQCYVLAAAQIGDHDPGRNCYGRSMVVDPWGTVIAQAPDEVGVTFADLDMQRLDRIRTQLPSLANRRLV